MLRLLANIPFWNVVVRHALDDFSVRAKLNPEYGILIGCHLPKIAVGAGDDAVHGILTRDAVGYDAALTKFHPIVAATSDGDAMRDGRIVPDHKICSGVFPRNTPRHVTAIAGGKAHAGIQSGTDFGSHAA